MKTDSSNMKNMIVSLGVDGSPAAKLLKEAWRAFRSLLKAVPSLIITDGHKLKGNNHVMDHLLGSKKRTSKHDGIEVDMRSHEAEAGHNNFTDLSLMMHTIRDEGGASAASGGCRVSVEEVDELADAFISRFYNNIRLEKQRSYRSYQEMLARGT